MARSRAFTLVELLVVIAIIALLMSILMPALNRVRKHARFAACKMNMHQWSLIWTLYCDDNDRLFPQTPASGWPRGKWVVALRSGWETRSEILRCPSARKRPPGMTGNHGGPNHTYVMGTGGPGDPQEECSYGFNCWLFNPKPGQNTIQKRPTAWNWTTPDVRGAENVPIFGDSMWRGGGPFSGETGALRIPKRGDPPAYDGEWDGAGKEMKHFCIDRHNGNIDMLFMDWSARKVGLKQLWKLKWHKEFNTSGPWTRAGLGRTPPWPAWMKNFKEY